MKDSSLMKDQKKRMCLFFITFLCVLTIHIVSKYVSTQNSYNGNDFVTQLLLPSKNTEVVLMETNSPKVFSTSDISISILESETKERIQTTNLTISIIRTKDSGNIIKVNYTDLETTEIYRNMFVEMKDIKKSVKNIFFIETRCSTEKMAVHFKDNKGFVLNARQCCAIESTALMNLDRKIYVFHSCSLDDEFLKFSPKFVEELFKYPNVYVVRLNISEAFSGTPLEELDKKKLLEKSTYPVEHTSDLIRLILLWRFGGTYSDLDVVTIRSLNNLETNWAGMQDMETIANGVINYEPGHKMLQHALEHVNRHYDPFNWSSNGPLLITPIILQECKVGKVLEASLKCHGNFKVLNSSVLYPIYYTSAEYFFDEQLGRSIVEDVKNRSYSVHLWNKMSRDNIVNVGSQQAYGLLADEYCPQVYQNCGSKF